jgi:tRNA-Thr(GGU) m(6)t(6)A37 methyltransferase TsaA
VTAHSGDGAGREICFRAIGVVKSAFDEPTKPDVMREADSQIVLDEALIEGLTGLEVGQSILVIFNFDRAPQTSELLQHPRGDPSNPKRGVFALRSPHRPNGIGVTAVELLAVEGNVLHVHGLDALNGTPVLDIKPDV